MTQTIQCLRIIKIIMFFFYLCYHRVEVIIQMSLVQHSVLSYLVKTKSSRMI